MLSGSVGIGSLDNRAKLGLQSNRVLSDQNRAPLPGETLLLLWQRSSSYRKKTLLDHVATS